ncbi:hypothetical protein AB0D49_41260 [Streptomyces sp. NPDC048290]|uniref:hypothetical protein n=1 Tax=Streptomyces sp. NPDC048290 TaxID=3155811 RepID=UPI00342D97FB
MRARATPLTAPAATLPSSDSATPFTDRHGEGIALTNVGMGAGSSGRAPPSTGRSANAPAKDAPRATSSARSWTWHGTRRRSPPLEIFEEVGDPHGVARGLADIGAALIEPHRHAEAAACRSAIDLFRRTNDPVGEDIARTNLDRALQATRGDTD